MPMRATLAFQKRFKMKKVVVETFLKRCNRHLFSVFALISQAERKNDFVEICG